jgi:hypothetical protein
VVLINKRMNWKNKQLINIPATIDTFLPHPCAQQAINHILQTIIFKSCSIRRPGKAG